MKDLSLLKRVTLGAITLGVGLGCAYADYPGAVVDAGPLLYYRLNGTVVPVTDTAMNIGSATSTGPGHYVSPVTHPVTGVLTNDSATAFSGGYMTYPFDPLLNPSTSFTVEAWLQPAATLSGSTLTCALASGNFASPRTGWLIYQAASGWNWRMYNQNGTSFSLNLVGGSAPTAGQWYHVVVSYDTVANSVQMYVNGAAAGSGTPAGGIPFVPNFDSPLAIGARSDVSFQWSGTADEVAVYPGVLTAAQVKAHFDAVTTNAASYASQVQSLSPLGFWRLDEPALIQPVAANLGTLGTAGNGSYWGGSSSVAGPRPPAYPAFETTNNAAQFDGSTGFVRAPQSGNLSGASLTNVTSATFLCWINRNGAQGGYKGVWAMRPLSTGLYLQSDDSLNYSWNDTPASYDFNSGLVPPSGEWTLAAVVVRPTFAAFYMGSASGGFVAATNTVNHAPSDFTSGPWAIGEDINNTGRFFNGAVDEAALFNFALPTGFIQSLFYTGIGSSVGPVMVSDPPTVTPAGSVYSTTPFSLAVDVAGTLPLSYQWRHNGTPITGATNLVYSKANSATSDNGTYDVVITNLYGKVTSQTATLTINPAVPPAITQSPYSRSTYVGGSASFSVTATGTQPLGYQWLHAGTNLPGATSNPLILTNVTAAMAGSYSVVVSNVAGTAPSGSATLSLISPTAGSYEATIIGYGPLAFWRLDETSGTTIAYDHIGGNDGTYQNVTQGVPGALNGDTDTAGTFDGATSAVTIGNPPALNLSGIITMTAWVRVQATDGLRNILSHGYQTSPNNAEDGLRIGSGTYHAWSWDGSTDHGVSMNIPATDIGVWTFIVGTYDGTNWHLYHNGVETARSADTVGALPVSSTGWAIGARGTGTERFFNGDIDEVAIFNTALTANQVYNLYLLGAYGRTTPPWVVQGPAAETLIAGDTATFTALGAGSPPLSYQWNSNGVPIVGATATTLSIPSVYYTYDAAYSVTIANSAGSTNSASASLTVVAPPDYENLTNGLVLHLKFDGSYTDSSGHGNDAIPVGNPTFVPGRIGSSALYVQSLGTLHDFAYVNYTPDFEFGTNDNWSIAFWVSYSGTPHDLPIVGNAANSTTGQGWVLTDEGGKLEWVLTSTDAGATSADPVPNSPNINGGGWHHVVLTIDKVADVASTYIDGSLNDIRSVAGVGNLDTMATVVFGQDPTGVYGETSNVNGSYSIDDVGIWRRALSWSEAQGIYQVGAKYNRSFDAVAPEILHLKQVGANLDLSWQAGTLLQSTSAKGPYTPVPGASAPFYRTTAAGATLFFRVQQ